MLLLMNTLSSNLSQRSVLVDSPMSLSSSVPQLSSNAVSTSSGGLSTLRRGGGKPATLASVTGAAGVKKERKKKDPNEPQKPVSAYALFFRDTQAAIKGQNPNASFGEVSKIVASMWDSLAEEQKQVDKLVFCFFFCFTVTFHLTRRNIACELVALLSCRCTRGKLKQPKRSI